MYARDSAAAVAVAAGAIGSAATAAAPADDANAGADTEMVRAQLQAQSALLGHDQPSSSNPSSPAHALPPGVAASASSSLPVRPRKHLSARASSGASDLSEYEEEEALQLAVTSTAPAAAVHQSSPYLSASLFSRLSYRWLSPLMDLGATRPLREEDMHEVMPADDARLLMEGIEAAARAVNEEDEQAEKERAASSGSGSGGGEQADPTAPRRTPRVHVWRMLIKQFFTQYFRVNLLLVIYSGFKIVQPLMLDRLVQFVSSDDEPSWHGYLYAVAMGLSALGQALVHHQYFFHAVRVGVDMRIALNALIYKKALTLKTTHFAKTTTGQVVNLVSNDSARAEEMTIYVGTRTRSLLHANPCNSGIAGNSRRVLLLFLSLSAARRFPSCGSPRSSAASSLRCCTSRWAWRPSRASARFCCCRPCSSPSRACSRATGGTPWRARTRASRPSTRSSWERMSSR